MIPPPTSCPRLRDTIQRAKYLPRTPEGARDKIDPASATYQQPTPIPLRALPNMRNLRHPVRYVVGSIFSRETNPLVSIFAVHVVGGATNRKSHGTDDQRPFDANFIDQRAAEKTNSSKHGVADSSAIPCKNMTLISNPENTLAQREKLAYAIFEV